MSSTFIKEMAECVVYIKYVLTNKGSIQNNNNNNNKCFFFSGPKEKFENKKDFMKR